MSRKICLVGKVDVLSEDKILREEELDFISSSRVIYPDLVFTLKQDSGKYYRPQVRWKDEKLIVVANNDFFRAVKEAGMPHVFFDLLTSGKVLPLGEIQDRYGLEFAPPAEQKNYLDKFFFFNQKPSMVDCASIGAGLYTSASLSPEYVYHHCLKYRLHNLEQDGAKRVRALVEILAQRNGGIRSIDGVRRIEASEIK